MYPASRIVLMKARIAARTDPKGKPLPGYKRNVEALKAEVARLEQCNGGECGPRGHCGNADAPRAAPSKDTP